MRRWRRPVLEEYDDEEEEEDDEEEVRRYIPPRPLRITRFSDFEGYEEGEDNIARFDRIKGLIRAGKYKPKPSDPWMAHIFYNNLKELGEI